MTKPQNFSGFPGGTVVKNLPVNAGDTGNAGLILGLGKIPQRRKWQPLQYFCLENPMARGAWWAIDHRSKRVVRNWETEHTQKFPGTTSPASYWSIICKL